MDDLHTIYKKHPCGALLWSKRKIFFMEWKPGDIGKMVGIIKIEMPFRVDSQSGFHELDSRLQCAAAWHLRETYGGLIHSSINVQKINWMPDYWVEITIKTMDVADYNLFIPEFTTNDRLI